MERSGKDLDHFMQEALREAGLKEGEEVKKTYFPQKTYHLFSLKKHKIIKLCRWTPPPTSTLSA